MIVIFKKRTFLKTFKNKSKTNDTKSKNNESSMFLTFGILYSNIANPNVNKSAIIPVTTLFLVTKCGHESIPIPARIERQKESKNMEFVGELDESKGIGNLYKSSVNGERTIRNNSTKNEIVQIFAIPFLKEKAKNPKINAIKPTYKAFPG